jgi:ribosomal protein S18 acetylase RimI-like enzyme
MGLIVQPLADTGLLSPLAADAEADGRRMVTRLLDDWRDGSNRFDQVGEQLYGAIDDAGHICGVCGLNRDPFAGDPSVARIRRLYVAVHSRRKGVATALLHRLIEDAQRSFATLHVRTDDAVAAALYQALGFERVNGDLNCTHRMRLISPRPPAAGQER